MLRLKITHVTYLIHLLSERTCQHKGRDLKIGEGEVVRRSVILLHYVHIEQILDVLLLDGDEHLFLGNIIDQALRKDLPVGRLIRD